MTRPWVLGCVLLVVVVVFVGIVTIAWMVAPRPSNLEQLVHERLAAHGDRNVALSDVAPVMRQAVVAAEDERFYRHHGIDSLGLVRAAVFDVSHLSLQQGASTITEQLGKVLYLGGDDHSPWRKLEDAALALRIERSYSKEEVLGAYLNTVYFGNGAYGIGAASRGYFGIPPARLDLADASMLAGMIQAPSSYDPFVDPAMARQRQAVVLESMVRNGFVTQTEAYHAVRSSVSLTSGRSVPTDADAVLVFPSLLSVPVLLWGVGLLALALACILNRRRWWPLKPASAVLVAVGLIIAARSLHAG